MSEFLFWLENVWMNELFSRRDLELTVGFPVLLSSPLARLYT